MRNERPKVKYPHTAFRRL